MAKPIRQICATTRRFAAPRRQFSNVTNSSAGKGVVRYAW
jgi:hypothetical protein